MNRFMALVLTMVLMSAYVQAADWGADVQTFNINGTRLGMTKTVITNENSQYKLVKPPESPLDVLSYHIYALPDENTKVGVKRPGVVINVFKNIYFNNTGDVVAIEVIFTNLDIDKRRFLLDSLDRKYEPVPDDRRNFWRYTVTPNVQLESTAIQTKDQRTQGTTVLPAEFTLQNLYMHKTEYRRALNESRKTIQLYNLL